jgi:molybdopterin-guanine dinucleotide biosynthesis protein
MPAKIPATIVTGFLGSGKTTLIRHMLQNANGKRIALIINEFGDLGVDGDILKAAAKRSVPRTISSNCRTAASAAPSLMISSPRWRRFWRAIQPPTIS